MYKCIYAYMYISYIYIHIGIYINVYLPICTYMYIYIHICICRYTYLSIYTYSSHSWLLFIHDLSLVWFIAAWFLTGGGGFKTRRRKEARGDFSGSALCHSYLHVSQNGLWTTRATSRNMKYNPRCLQCMNDI